MKNSNAAIFSIVFAIAGLAASLSCCQEKEIPDALKPWTNWVTWDDKHLNCPTPYNNGDEHLCFWPAQMTVKAEPQTGHWEFPSKCLPRLGCRYLGAANCRLLVIIVGQGLLGNPEMFIVGNVALRQSRFLQQLPKRFRNLLQGPRVVDEN